MKVKRRGPFSWARRHRTDALLLTLSDPTRIQCILTLTTTMGFLAPQAGERACFRVYLTP